MAAVVHRLLLVARWLSGLGFAAVLTTHLLTFAVEVPIDCGLAPSVAIFPLWFGVVLLTIVDRDPSDTGWFGRGNQWKGQLRGCPAWMYNALYIVLGYVVLNAVRALPRDGSPAFVPDARFVTAHLLIFYWVAFSTFYSALRVLRTGSAPAE